MSLLLLLSLREVRLSDFIPPHELAWEQTQKLAYSRVICLLTSGGKRNPAGFLRGGPSPELDAGWWTQQLSLPEWVCPTPQDEAACQDSAPLGGGEAGSLLEPSGWPAVFGAQGKRPGFHKGCQNQSR